MNYFSNKKNTVIFCHFDGCTETGVHRAPKKDQESCIKDDSTWNWFCLQHVRLYNAGWNYYKYMDEEEIFQEWRRDISWQRPTWPIGKWHSNNHLNQWRKAFKNFKTQEKDFDDPFDLFSQEQEKVEQSQKFYASSFPKNTLEEKAIKLFDLAAVFTLKELQISYRKLVKKHHPDANNGSVKSEEAIKVINQAYALLKNKSYNL